MEMKEFKKIIDDHKLWLDGLGGNRADLRNARLNGANLGGVNLTHAMLANANLCRADLTAAVLIGADLDSANLSNATLRHANLSDATLFYADLRNAKLQHATLRGASLHGAQLQGANLHNASLWNCVGNRCHIKTLLICNDYPITYTYENLQIGCECHPIADWWEFDDEQILQMGKLNGIKFWREWKCTIRMLIEKSPAHPTQPV